MRMTYMTLQFSTLIATLVVALIVTYTGTFTGTPSKLGVYVICESRIAGLQSLESIREAAGARAY